MTEYYLSVGYALSDRSQCKGCGKMIDKGGLRISYVTNIVDKYPYDKFYHDYCFTVLPKTVQNQGLNEIKNYEFLRELDQKQIKSRIENLKANLNSKGNQKKKIKQEKSIQKKQKIQLIQLDSDESDDFEELIEPLNPEQLNTNFLKVQDDEFNSDGELKPDGYNDAEWRVCKQYLECLDNHTAYVLREMLRYNNQDTKGHKQQLIERVADCIALGAIPKCPKCKQGSLKYDKWTGAYHCIGYPIQNGWVNCNQFFLKQQINRKTWKYIS